jgi:hypothetical protein
VDELLERWEYVPDGEIMHGGVGIIVPVQRHADGPVVVKVSFPHPGNVHEPDDGDEAAAVAGQVCRRLAIPASAACPG